MRCGREMGNFELCLKYTSIIGSAALLMSLCLFGQTLSFFFQVKLGATHAALQANVSAHGLLTLASDQLSHGIFHMLHMPGIGSAWLSKWFIDVIKECLQACDFDLELVQVWFPLFCGPVT